MLTEIGFFLNIKYSALSLFHLVIHHDHLSSQLMWMNNLFSLVAKMFHRTGAPQITVTFPYQCHSWLHKFPLPKSCVHFLWALTATLSFLLTANTLQPNSWILKPQFNTLLPWMKASSRSPWPPHIKWKILSFHDPALSLALLIHGLRTSLLFVNILPHASWA